MRVVRAGRAPLVQRSGRRYAMLTPDLPGQRASVSRHELEPGASTGDDPLHEAGSSEFVWIEAGRVTARGRRDVARARARRQRRVRRRPAAPLRERRPCAGDVPVRRLRRPEEVLMGRTLYEKIWDEHAIGDDLLFVDLHLVHEVTSAQAFEGLKLAGRKVRRPDRTIATADHNTPTHDFALGVERPDLEAAARRADGQLRGVRRPPLRVGPRAAGHRARDRPGARPDPAGPDDRLRRLAHRHARGVRVAGVRHRHQRGRARAGDADPAAEALADPARALRGRAGARRRGQGPGPRPDRPGGHGRDGRPRRGVQRARRSRRSPWRAA